MSIASIHHLPESALERAEGLLRQVASRPRLGFATVVVGRGEAEWSACGPFLADDERDSERLAADASAHLSDRVYVGPVRVAELRLFWARAT